jgi:hypothetical protein
MIIHSSIHDGIRVYCIMYMHVKAYFVKDNPKWQENVSSICIYCVNNLQIGRSHSCMCDGMSHLYDEGIIPLNNYSQRELSRLTM